jgi:hypothetical protein
MLTDAAAVEASNLGIKLPLFVFTSGLSVVTGMLTDTTGHAL